MVFKLLKKDPVEQAKKHIERAMTEIQDGYHDYASVEYEKAARLFLEAEKADFAIKYFRESSYCALQHGDHMRAAELKLAAGAVLIAEARFEEAGNLYAESSDHLLREKKLVESTRAGAVSVLNYLAAKSFDTAVNMLRKTEKRIAGVKDFSEKTYDLAGVCVGVLCEGTDVTPGEFTKLAATVKPTPEEVYLFEFVTGSTKIALETQVTLDWAGPPMSKVTVKSPVEFEFGYRCPVPVRVIAHKYSLSSSVVFEKEPVIAQTGSDQESWLVVVKPVLSGSAVVGPFRLTLEGENVLINRRTQELRFEIEKAPASLELTMTPARLSCSLGDELVFDAVITNSGDGPADNIEVELLLSGGLQLTVGSSKKVVQYVGVGEQMRFQIYVRPTTREDGLITVKVTDPKGPIEITKTSSVKVT